MFRYQVLLEYDGKSFVGWQIQKKGKSVQEIVQFELSKLFKNKINIYGSGRTDKGVHAIEQSAHFDRRIKILDIKKKIKSLNFFLNPKNISILNIKKKNSNFHARYSAKERIYKYIILNRASPPSIDKSKVWHIRKKLNIKLMKRGAKKLIGTHDFSTFRASNCYSKSPIRTMKKVTIKKSKDKIIFHFRSKSFLRNQVRSMVGCLKLLGEEKWSLEEFISAFKAKNRSSCAPPAISDGLYLEKIIY